MIHLDLELILFFPLCVLIAGILIITKVYPALVRIERRRITDKGMKE